MPIPKDVFYRTVSFLRKQFTWSDAYKAVRKRCRVSEGVSLCEGCGRFICASEASRKALFELGSIQFPDIELVLEKFAVDHISPVGVLTGLDQAGNRIFCDISNLMGLCMSCHYFKSRVDLEEIKESKYGSA